MLIQYIMQNAMDVLMAISKDVMVILVLQTTAAQSSNRASDVDETIPVCVVFNAAILAV